MGRPVEIVSKDQPLVSKEQPVVEAVRKEISPKVAGQTAKSSVL
jgi:hypothetical protein